MKTRRRHFLLLLFTFITVNSYGQVFTKMAGKIGISLSGQIRTPNKFENSKVKSGLSLTVEPTILTFGNNKNFDLNIDLSFIQKGSTNYAQESIIVPGGSVSYTKSNTILINYFSFSPTLKYSFLQLLFIKVGPRMDTFLGYWGSDIIDTNFPTKEDFNNLTFGISYGFGLCLGQKKLKYLIEFVGQNDFSNSLYNPSTNQDYRNYSFIINAGLLFQLGNGKEDKG